MLPKLSYPLFPLVIPSTKQEIQVRQILARDEKILLMAKASVGEVNVDILNAVRQVIRSCIMTPGVDVDKLALFDVEYLFIRLRALSVSNIIKVAYQDNDELEEYQAAVVAEREKLQLKPHQQLPQELAAKLPLPKAYEFSVDLDKVNVKFPEQEMKISVGDNIVIEMKYPDCSLYTNKQFLEAKSEQILDLLIQNSIHQISEGEKHFDPDTIKNEEFLDFLNGLPMSVYDKLRAFLGNLPSINYELKYVNKYGKERTIVLQTLSDFFLF